MALSGTYSDTVTRDQLIAMALRTIGVTSQGDTPSATIVDEAVLRLGLLIKDLSNELGFAWQYVWTAANVLVGANTVTISPEVLAIDEAYITVNGNNIPLRRMAIDEYVTVSNTNMSGIPSAYIIKPAENVVAFDVAMGSAGTFNYRQVRMLQDWTSGSDPNLKSNVLLALMYGLSFELSTEHVIPLSERQFLENQYEKKKQRAKAANREWHGGGRLRPIGGMLI